MGGAFYVWDPYLGISGQFVAQTIGSPYYMGPNESFEVRTVANGNTLSFMENNKGTSVTAVLMRNTPDNHVTLYVYDTAYHPWDIWNLNFNEVATDGDDAKYDGDKPPSPAALNFYSWSADNSKLALDVRSFTADRTIPLGITSSYAQEFIIRAEDMAMPQGEQLYLHDKYLQSYTLLQQGTEYKFSITKDGASQGDNRFELGMNPTGIAAVQNKGLDVDIMPNPATDEVTISYNARAKANTTVRIINVEGITVITQKLGLQQSGSVKIGLAQLASGVYLVELTSGTDKVVHRLVKE